MDDKGRPRVGQFSIEDGNWQESPANIGIFDAKARRSRHSRGDLYVLVETPRNSHVPPSLHGEMISAIADTYYESSGSVTRGLRGALLAANRLLFEHNLRADSQHRAVVGLNCAVVREDDVYIGQIGPALISSVSKGRLERYPPDSIWFRSESPSSFDLDREPPAGLRREIEPNLFHLSLVPGAVLILSTTDLVRMMSTSELLDAVTYTGSETVRSNLEALAKGRDLSAIVLKCPGGSPPAQPQASTPPAVVSKEDRESAAPAEPSLGTEVEPPVVEERPAVPGPSPAERVPARDIDVRDDDLEWTSEDDYAAPRSDAQVAMEASREPLDGLRDNLSEGAARVRDGARDLLLRILPESVPERPPRATREPPVSLSSRALIFLALAIPLIMLVLVVLTRIQYDRARFKQFDTIKVEAQTVYDDAVGRQDPGAVRTGLYDALAIVNEGLAISPTDDTLVPLKRRIQIKLDELNVVTRLYHFWQLGKVEDDAVSATDSSRIVIHDFDIFLLNRGSDRVYRFLLNDVGDALQPLDGDSILVQKGQVVRGVELGEMVDIAWMQEDERRTLSALVVLERNGALLSYVPQQGIDALPVADSALWLKPQAISGYFGNLYVLDPLLNRILKYVPTDNAYTNPPSDYLSHQLDIDLTGAVDMAIDGNVYVLFADGRIVKFLRGEPQTYNMHTLPTPMQNPTTIFVSGPQEPDGEGYVYVTDAGNERVIQFDKEGNFLRQFKAKQGESQMQRLRGIYVDEARKRMFLLSGRTLWLAEIPPLAG